MKVEEANNSRELFVRISDGDEAAFAFFFKKHYGRLRPFVSRFFRSDLEVDDALQEVFIKVWLNRDKLPHIDNIGAWLRTITSRVCLTAIQKDLTRGRHTQQFSATAAGVPETPLERTSVAEIRRLVAAAVEGMPEARKRIYLLSRQDGLKPAEIAQHLSISVNTVRNTLVSALKDIRSYLEQHGHQLSLLFLFFTFF